MFFATMLAFVSRITSTTAVCECECVCEERNVRASDSLREVEREGLLRREEKRRENIDLNTLASHT